MRPVAVITGGTRGIGRAISMHLYGSGYHVVAVYRSERADADELTELLRSGPGKFEARRADLASSAETSEIATSIMRACGPPALLVNNAGAIRRPSYWREQTIDDALGTVRANLDVTMNVIWSFARAMAEAGGGQIINISSTYGTLGEAHVLAYTAAKAGIDALTKGLARDLGPSGVTVNTISPAVVLTEMTMTANEEFIAASEARTPTRALATPADVARCVQFITSNPMINGINLIVDGGLHLTGP